MTPATRLKSTRLVHHYIGVFFAPTILFFAITGALQMLGLHESRLGSSYTPPPLLVRLAQLHKKGTLSLPPSKRPSLAPAARPPAATAEAANPVSRWASERPPSQSGGVNPLPMKIFFVTTALALVISTGTGLYMAWRYARRKFVVAIFAAGIACPLIALFL